VACQHTTEFDGSVFSSSMTANPYLLLDVDGVLVLRAEQSDPWQRHEVVSATGETHTVWLNPLHGVWIGELSVHFELVWATGWQHDAPRLLGPLLGIPPAPAITFTEAPQPGVVIDKLPDIITYVGDRPVAWVDDHLSPAEFEWARSRPEPTLLVQPNPTVGLSEDHVSMMLHFAAEQERDIPPSRNAR
jgi:hypothetical protein